MRAHRADLHRLLRKALPASCLHLGADCIEVSRDRFAVARFAGGAEVEADAIITAGGIRSTIRVQLFGQDDSRFTEQMC